MKLIKEAIGKADTVDAAKEQALLELNAPLDAEVSFEIITMPKKKTLGLFGGSQAEVRAFIEVEEAAESRPNKKPARPRAEKAPRSEQKAAQPKKAVVAAQPEEAVKVTPANEVAPDSPAGKGIAYLHNVLEKLGCTDADITVNAVEGGTQINIAGDGLGVVIGHRGETLDALQYLVSLAANAGQTGYHRIVLNTGDFRKRREQTLISLAKRMADQAIKSGKCRTLEPMNPYERRIIHTTVQQIEGVISTSFGEGTARRVVIAPEGKEPRPRMDYGRGQRGGRRGDRGYSRPRREAYQPQVNPDKAPVKDADAMPLYGKINK